MLTIPEALSIGLEHHQAGRLQDAELVYRRILDAEPNHPDALHLLGVIAQQSGRRNVAIEYIGAAIRLRDTDAAFHNNLGIALKDQGRIPEAVASYQRALRLQPGFAAARSNLGNALKAMGQLAEAVSCYRQVVELTPDQAAAHNSLGNALRDQGQLADAVACYRRALQLNPEYPDAHHNLGNALKALGKVTEAVASYQRAVQLNPGLFDAHNNLGNALKALGRLPEAVVCYRRALQLKPDFAGACTNLGCALNDLKQLPEAIAWHERALQLQPDFCDAHNNLGNALRDQGQLTTAIASYQRALQLRPDSCDALNNLGAALKDQGELEEAISCYRRMLQLNPHDSEAHSNLLFALNFCPDQEARTIYEESRRWNQQHAEPLAMFVKPHANDATPARRLRMGYVSPDFRGHSVGRFMLPLLESHDRAAFEIFCYASVTVPDTVTDRCRHHADVWRNVTGFSDADVASTVREDRIDILVDLSMHTAKNRLLVFARKPAPVQATYLAYPGTTGLSAIDYRLTDPYLDLPGQDDRRYSEKSIRLPETYWCYAPVLRAPAVNALPALKTGYVTFGCLNNFCKVSAPTLAAWSRILQAVPESRLVLHASAGTHRDRVRDGFARQGVSPEHLIFEETAPLEEYLRIYERIDLALDPWPHGGGTTTCDALWMGVPAVSLAGQTAVGRGGLSILSNVGLSDLVADDVEQYIRIAVESACDLPRLSLLRQTMRDRMQSSPLMDAPRFARNIEAAFRSMWRRWCAAEPPANSR